MSDATIIDQVAMERILYVIEESLRICSRTQFYGWAQGALQGLLPHEMLLCISGDLPSFRFKCSSFACTAEDQRIIEKLTDPVNGLLVGIVETWLGIGRKPLLYTAGVGGTDVGVTAAKLRSLGCGHALAHGACDISSNEGSFFLFLRMSNAPKSRQGYLLDLVMPHLHMALYRMLRSEGDARTPEQATQSILSERETDVLRWVGQGKTNQEIGSLLDISPLTVKNHVQKILRKLGVSNRAQAVSKAHAAHLIGARTHARAPSSAARNEPAMIAAQNESE